MLDRDEPVVLQNECECELSGVGRGFEGGKAADKFGGGVEGGGREGAKTILKMFHLHHLRPFLFPANTADREVSVQPQGAQDTNKVPPKDVDRARREDQDG